MALVVICAATVVLRSFGDHVNPTTVALTFLLIVLFLATAWGSKPAVLASIVAASSFNYFFLPPVGTFTISDPHNWVAIIAFLLTAVTVGQLSARAKQRTEEAEVGKREIERLYEELRDAFERASHAEALRQSEKLKSALLDAVTTICARRLRRLRLQSQRCLMKCVDEQTATSWVRWITNRR